MKDFIEQTILQAELTLESRPAESADQFICTLKSPHGEMTRTIRMRQGRDAPNVHSLLFYWAENLQQVWLSEDILDWAEEYRYDPADPESRALFQNLVADEDALRLVLSDEVYQHMMAGLEIHQAIHAARPG